MGLPSSNPRSFLYFPVLSIFLPFYLTLFIITASPSTIYDHLRLQGLPVGLLPKEITNYSINATTGYFRVFLDHPCNAKFENQIHYDFNISGYLSYGQIEQLSGVSAQELFLWFRVKGIRVDVPSSGLIHFDVGVVDKQFSLSLFESPPDCTVADPINSDIAVDPSRLGLQVHSGKLEHKAGGSDVLKASS